MIAGSRYSAHEFDLASGLLHTALHLHLKGTPDESIGPVAGPFITISRQSGAAGRSFARRLVDRLNLQPHLVRPWSCWDRELVEKVSAEHEIDAAIVEMMENQKHDWVRELLDSIPTADARHHPDEFKVYRRVAITIQALAQAGRAVIVGRGGVFLTGGVPGGIHLRIVAPLSDRVAHMAERDGISREAAAARVADVERNREAFYHRHWPGRSIGPETFTLTLNSAQMSVDEMIDCALSLVRSREPHPRSSEPRPIEFTTTGGAQPNLPHASPAGGV